ncbi:MAG: cupin domain-containing protein [Candidatus Rokuibacteriota bacterium]
MSACSDAEYARRARYFSSADGFNIARPKVPAQVFAPQREAALDPAGPSGLIPLDLSDALAIGFPATTPLILARYARIRSGEKLETCFAATGAIHYVIAGGGESAWGSEVLAWQTGDVFVLPGGAASHRAGADSLLWIVTNEPELAFSRARPPAPGAEPVGAVHYPAAEIRRQLEAIHRLPPDQTMTGKAVTFSSVALDRERTCLPSLTLAMNSLRPGESQRSHRHNAVAVTLIVEAARCYSLVGGARIEWQPHAVMITPPGAVHSHHNDGDRLARFLIVQDGGLHYHCRTMGFAYA